MSEYADKTYYEMLGVSTEASSEEIRDAYKSIARAYHPDSNFYDEILKDSKNYAPPDQEKFKKITEAYNTLISEEKRKQYDSLFPKGLKSWEDGEKSKSFDDSDQTFAGKNLSAATYRPRGQTAAFKRSSFGLVESSENPESAIESELRRSAAFASDTAESTDRRMLAMFFSIISIGFFIGALLAYWLVTHRR